jgi:hypothetical protein
MALDPEVRGGLYYMKIGRVEMNRRQFVKLSTIAAAAAGFSRSAPGNTARPNFVFILADDLGWTDLGCYGSTLLSHPEH